MLNLKQAALTSEEIDMIKTNAKSTAQSYSNIKNNMLDPENDLENREDASKFFPLANKLNNIIQEIASKLPSP
jgi:hypothetical protein